MWSHPPARAAVVCDLDLGPWDGVAKGAGLEVLEGARRDGAGGLGEAEAAADEDADDAEEDVDRLLEMGPRRRRRWASSRRRRPGPGLVGLGPPGRRCPGRRWRARPCTAQGSRCRGRRRRPWCPRRGSWRSSRRFTAGRLMGWPTMSAIGLPRMKALRLGRVPPQSPEGPPLRRRSPPRRHPWSP